MSPDMDAPIWAMAEMGARRDAFVRLQFAGQDLHKGGLARAVFAHQTYALAVVKFKGSYVQHRAQAIGLAHAVGFDEKFIHKKHPHGSHGSAKKAA